MEWTAARSGSLESITESKIIFDNEIQRLDNMSLTFLPYTITR